MIKTIFLSLISLIFAISSSIAQKKDFNYKFYGFVRVDFAYNSRASVAPFGEAFYLHPLDVEIDADGKDINSTASSNFSVFITRLGLDVAGPKIGTAKTQAKIEIDFGGFSLSNTMLRIRRECNINSV